MSHDYKAVQWTPFKVRFDRWMLAGVAVYLVGFVAVRGLLAVCCLRCSGVPVGGLLFLGDLKLPSFL